MIGKKGRLFSNTLKGARASAVVYSIAEMAKENGLIPFAYFKYLHEKMSNLGDGDLEEPSHIPGFLPFTVRLIPAKTISNQHFDATWQLLYAYCYGTAGDDQEFFMLHSLPSLSY